MKCVILALAWSVSAFAESSESFLSAPMSLSLVQTPAAPTLLPTPPRRQTESDFFRPEGEDGTAYFYVSEHPPDLEWRRKTAYFYLFGAPAISGCLGESPLQKKPRPQPPIYLHPPDQLPNPSVLPG
ncbi:MAG TPA: hypothetical protein VF593_10070 [Chthoniobacteraceae bacterium]|jgi:hypothetical protein